MFGMLDYRAYKAFLLVVTLGLGGCDLIRPTHVLQQDRNLDQDSSTEHHVPGLDQLTTCHSACSFDPLSGGIGVQN
jgi:hypothetical protein